MLLLLFLVIATQRNSTLFLISLAKLVKNLIYNGGQLS